MSLPEANTYTLAGTLFDETIPQMIQLAVRKNRFCVPIGDRMIDWVPIESSLFELMPQVDDKHNLLIRGQPSPVHQRPLRIIDASDWKGTLVLIDFSDLKLPYRPTMFDQTTEQARIQGGRILARSQNGMVHLARLNNKTSMVVVDARGAVAYIRCTEGTLMMRAANAEDIGRLSPKPSKGLAEAS